MRAALITAIAVNVVLALVVWNLSDRLRGQQCEIDKLRRQRYDLLVKHEGWRSVEGLPFPIPPRPNP